MSKTILTIDDSRTMREMLSHTLSGAGYRVLQAVDGVEGDVGRSVEADGDVGAVDVVVDGGRHARHGHAVLLVQCQRTAEAAVPADHDEAVDAVRPQPQGSLGAALRLVELVAAGRAQDGAATLDDVRHAAHAELLDVVVDQPLEAAVDARDAQAVVPGGAHHGADRGVHAGRVAAAGEHADV